MVTPYHPCLFAQRSSPYSRILFVCYLGGIKFIESNKKHPDILLISISHLALQKRTRWRTSNRCTLLDLVDNARPSPLANVSFTPSSLSGQL